MVATPRRPTTVGNMLHAIPDYFRTQRAWMLLTGVWPPITAAATWMRFVLYALRTVFQVALFLIMLHVAVVFYVTFYLEVATASFARIAYCLSQAVIFSFAAFSTFYFQFRAEASKRMVDYMNGNFHFRSAKGLTYVTAERSFRVCSFITSWYIYVSEVSVLQWAVYPFFAATRTLPLVAWYPFDELASPAYEFVYVIQTIAQIELALVFCTSSAFTLSASIMICGQYDVLFCSLKNLMHTAQLNNGKYANVLRAARETLDLTVEAQKSRFYICSERPDEQFEDYLAENRSERNEHKPKRQYGPNDTYQMELVPDLERALNDCIRHHQVIVRCCDQLEDIASPFVLVKSIEISFQICILALTFMKTTGSVVDNINTAQYIILTLVDLFVISYMGQIVQNQSVRVRDFLFETPWYRFGAPIRRSMLIMQLYTKEPKIITGGRFFIMGYDKCIAIIKLAFSYFTLLNTIGSK